MTPNDVKGEDNYHFEDGVPIFDRRLSSVEHEQERVTQRQLRLSEPTAFFTLALVLVGGGSGIISVWQASIANKSANAAQSAAATASATLEEMKRSGNDTHQLALDADKQADAALRQLTLQDASVREAHQQAAAAQAANKTAIGAERPWIGTGISVQNLEAGKQPLYTMTFFNTGRRPAKITLVRAQAAFYTKFPSEPYYEPVQSVSTSLVVPGQTVVNTWSGKGVLTEAEMNIIKTGETALYVYAHVEYTDVGTNDTHWSHACFRYLSSFTPNSGGFVNCAEYNESK